METKITCILLCIAILALDLSFAQNLFVAAPNTLRLGANETVAIFSHHHGQHKVEVHLTDFPGRKKLFSKRVLTVTQDAPGVVNVLANPEDILDLNLTASTEKHYVLLVAKSHEFHREIKILVSPFSGYMFLQTDKPIYTPTQPVNIRILSLDEDMAPDNHTFTFQIRNPQGIILEKLASKELKSENGIYIRDFRFPKNAPKGIWSVVVFYGLKVPRNSTVTFELSEYILPTYELKISAPEVVLPSDQTIKVSVDATYVYGQKVDGFADFRFGFKPEGQETISFGNIDDIELKNGYAQTEFAVDHMKKNKKIEWFPRVRGGRLVVEATVRERATGDREIKTHSSTVFDVSPYHISFDRCLNDFKPGMTTIVEAEVKYINGKVAKGVPTVIKVTDNAGKKVDVQFPTSISNSDGKITFFVNTQLNQKNMKITLRTESPHMKPEEQADGKHTMVSFTSKDLEYIALKRTDPLEALKVGSKTSWTVYSYPDQSLPLSYVITSQGRIVDKGSLTKKETERNIVFTVTHEMVPGIRITIFAHNKKQILTDSIKLNVENVCSPKGNIEMEIKFDQKNPEPGDEAEIKVTGVPWTSVGILAVDKAVYALRDKDLLTKEKMFKEMENHDLGCGPGGGTNSVAVLENAGLVLLTNTETSATQRQGYTCDERKRRKREIKEEIHETHGRIEDLVNEHTRKCCELGTREDKRKRSCVERATIVQNYKGEGLKDPEVCGLIFLKCCEEAEKPLLVAHMSRVKQDGLVTSQRHISPGRAGGDEEELSFLKDDELAASEEGARERNDFRETWLFQIQVIDTGGTMTLKSNLPHSVTSWVVQAVSVSPKAIGGGMCVTEPKTIEVFKSVFIQVKMPYNVVRNEQIEIPVTIFNYSPKRLPVVVYFYGLEDLCSEAQPGEKSTTKRIYVPKNSAVSTGFSMVPMEAKVYNIKFVATSPTGVDIVEKKLHVISEGQTVIENIAFSIDPSNTQKRKRRSIVNDKYSINFDEEKKEQLSVVRLTPEVEYIPGTESCHITAIGDKFGSTVNTSLDNPDRLLRMPTGCGEQTMAYLAPTLYTLHYLKVTGKLTAAREGVAYNFVREGYKRELTFRKPDGSYAAWINRESSTWLTAFVAKVFCQADKYIFIDETTICTALSWLARNQQPDGSFLERYAIIHKEMMGGVVGKVPLTAFVLLAFEKCKCGTMNTTATKDAAVSFLKQQIPLITDPYHMAIATYALAVANPELSAEYNKGLLDMARFDEGLNHVYWGDGKSSKSLETTSYALHVQLIHGNMDVASSIVNWMGTQRSVGGAFWSTQDTVAAIEALSEYAILARDPEANLVCNITSTNDPNFRETIVFNQGNARLLQMIELKKLGGRIHVEAEGSGYGVMGFQLKYNVPVSPDKLCKFELFVNVSEAKEISVMEKPAEADELEDFFPRSLVEELELEKAKKKAAVAGEKFRNVPAGHHVRNAGRVGGDPPPGVVIPEIPHINPPEFPIPQIPRRHIRPQLHVLRRTHSHTGLGPIERKRRSIVVNPNKIEGKSTMNSKSVLNVTICTKYLDNQPSNMAVVDVGIVTGYKADVKDLKKLVNDSSLPIARFEESGRSIIFYLDEISNVKTTCFWFRIAREFIASHVESSVVKVYDYYEPTHRCSEFYTPDQKSAIIRTECTGTVCVCAEGGCPAKEPFKTATDLKDTNQQREMLQEIACSEHHFFWKIRVNSKEELPSGFWLYNFYVESVLKQGAEKENDLEDATREFKARINCDETANLKVKGTYLIMGRDQEPIEEDGLKKYIYYIDKTTRIYEWRTSSKGLSRAAKNLQKNFLYVEKQFLEKKGCHD